MPGHRRLAVGHLGSDDGGGEAADGDPVPCQQRPQAVGSGVIDRAVVEQHGPAQGEHSHDLPGAHHPAEVGEPEHRVVFLEVEGIGHVHRRLHREPALDVDRALGPPGGAGRVDDQERILGRGVLGFEEGGLGGDRLVPPEIAPRRPGDVAAQPAVHQHLAHRGSLPQRLVRRLLHRHRPAAAEEPVRGEERPRARVAQAGRQRRGRVPGEHGHVHGADAGHGQGGDGALGREGHVDADAVPLADPQPPQRAGEPTHLRQQLTVGDGPDGALLVLVPDGDLVSEARQVAVEAGLDVVQPPIEPPARPGEAVRTALHARERPAPREREVLAHGPPEPVGVLDGAAVERGVVGQAVRAREAKHAAPGEVMGAGAPDDLPIRGIRGGHAAPLAAAHG